MPDRTAIVTYKGRPAGRLSELGVDTRFVYDAGWEDTIACALPVTTRDHYWRNGLIPFFEHLGPEGWLRGRQARAGGTANQDDLGLLLNYGADCIGAVGIRPLEDHASTPHPDGNLVDEAAAAPGRTLSGVQKKLLAFQSDGEFRPCLQPTDPATHIAKFNRDDLRTLVQNEDISLKLAREVLGSAEVTNAQIGVLPGIDGIALLVERFDRLNEERLRLEDFAQILQIPRGREFDGKYNSSYEDAAGAIKHFSSRSKIDLDRYFRLLIFNFVIGNADAHLKNFSLLERPEGLRLSPAYDLLNTLVYPNYDRQTALSIGGQKRSFDSLTRPLIEMLGNDIGLPRAAIARSLEQLGQRFAKVSVPRIPEQAGPDDIRVRYREIMDQQARKILA